MKLQVNKLLQVFLKTENSTRHWLEGRLPLIITTTFLVFLEGNIRCATTSSEGTPTRLTPFCWVPQPGSPFIHSTKRPRFILRQAPSWSLVREWNNVESPRQSLLTELRAKPFSTPGLLLEHSSTQLPDIYFWEVVTSLLEWKTPALRSPSHLP